MSKAIAAAVLVSVFAVLVSAVPTPVTWLRVLASISTVSSACYSWFRIGQTWEDR